MELSPPSANVRYFVIYPQAWWEDDPHLGDSTEVARAGAAAIVADSQTIPTADLRDFVWSYDMEGHHTGSMTVELGPGPFYFSPFVNYACDWTVPDPVPCHGIAVAANTPYSGGGTNVPMDPDGGVNSWLVEVTAVDPTGFGVTEDDTYLVACSASLDGGQLVRVITQASQNGAPWGTYVPLQDVLSRLKFWRMPTRVWPHIPEPPPKFWTRLVGAREIL